MTPQPRCPRCASHGLTREPARIRCLICGWQRRPRRVAPYEIVLQLKIDAQLRPVSAECRGRQ